MVVAEGEGLGTSAGTTTRGLADADGEPAEADGDSTDAEGEAAIVVVRHQAKEEPPLRNLRFNTGLGSGGGTDLFTVIAEITVHGRTGNGRAVSTMGRLQINFADFADTP